MIPYLKLKLGDNDKLPIKYIRIGPAANKNLRNEA